MRRLTRETCDQLVNIPMLGSVESLNVSVASAVCLCRPCASVSLIFRSLHAVFVVFMPPGPASPGGFTMRGGPGFVHQN